MLTPCKCTRIYASSQHAPHPRMRPPSLTSSTDMWMERRLTVLPNISVMWNVLSPRHGIKRSCVFLWAVQDSILRPSWRDSLLFPPYRPLFVIKSDLKWIPWALKVSTINCAPRILLLPALSILQITFVLYAPLRCLRQQGNLWPLFGRRAIQAFSNRRRRYDSS